MMLPTTRKNLLLSLALSIVLTIVCGVIYFVYPVVAAIVSARFGQSQSGTGGIGAVAGGASFQWLALLDPMSLLTFVLLITPAIFLFCFLVFERRSARH